MGNICGGNPNNSTIDNSEARAAPRPSLRQQLPAVGPEEAPEGSADVRGGAPRPNAEKEKLEAEEAAA